MYHVHFLNFLKHQSIRWMDLQWRNRNLSDFIKKKSYGFGTTWGWEI